MYERRLKVETIHFVNRWCFVLDFRSPEIAAACQPGQFLMLSAGDRIDPLLRRPMAVYEVKREQGEPVGFSVLVERTGRGTTLLSRLTAGDEIDILGPLGRPFRAPVAATDTAATAEGPAAAGTSEALLVMGGVGSAPFPLFAADLLTRGIAVRAFIGGRTAERLLCAADFEQLGVPVELATDDGSAGHHGLVTEILEAHLAAGSGGVTLYSCGPTPMMRAVDDIARRRELPHQVSLEAPMACGIGVCLSCVVPVRDDQGWHYERICREGPVFDAGTLHWEHPDDR